MRTKPKLVRLGISHPLICDQIFIIKDMLPSKQYFSRGDVTTGKSGRGPGWLAINVRVGIAGSNSSDARTLAARNKRGRRAVTRRSLVRLILRGDLGHERPPIRVHRARQVGDIFRGQPDVTVLVGDCRGVVAPASDSSCA